ncbi:MAG: hypothetical protein IIW80_08775 [Treponema sp.]|nr:hypothetical protein [Treponema sp.]
MDFAISAGIVAVLSVQPTKKRNSQHGSYKCGNGNDKKAVLFEVYKS